ncbi:PD-(D/E)XK nuclease family protein [Parafrankia sp. EUN1f]|uniref:RecB family exonuclease n=1 Tax=Parafrankia sp. EUN1f TaxID=102897 RepID=UPI0001C47551|nr:PD-(D/E)XK nuclease family protein [Parafrankia sp. EUN1f]EFC79321.1 RecB family exonuclease-like protein [Parafrankia sp. EUN1f]
MSTGPASAPPVPTADAPATDAPGAEVAAADGAAAARPASGTPGAAGRGTEGRSPGQLGGGPGRAGDPSVPSVPSVPSQGPRPVASLSPSRAADFVNCPLRYRFRVIDRIPEPPSEAATRGTVVHGVLERLFDLPPRERTQPAAAGLVEPVWADLLARDASLGGLFTDPTALAAWLDSARDLLTGYFTLEDPRRLAPAARELYVEHVLGSGLRLRGYVDRLDEAQTPQGTALRVIDYKTGRSPGPAFEGAAMFQMRFYALVLWRSRGVLPRELRLYYLGDRTWLRAAPDEAELRATERRIEALWAAIARAHSTGDWRATPGRLCDWCDHKARCPAFGGTPPPLPESVAEVPVEDGAPAVCEADG